MDKSKVKKLVSKAEGEINPQKANLDQQLETNEQLGGVNKALQTILDMQKSERDNKEAGELGKARELVSKYLEGVRGDKGDQGPEGPTGKDGRGLLGPQGLMGPRGMQGIKGEKGDKGDSGERGERGFIGLSGRDGKNGKDANIDPKKILETIRKAKNEDKLDISDLRNGAQFTAAIGKLKKIESSGFTFNGNQYQFSELMHGGGSSSSTPGGSDTEIQYNDNGAFGGIANFTYDNSTNDITMSGTSDANLFFLDYSTNRIGIGTNSPTQKLEVNGNIISDISFVDDDPYGGSWNGSLAVPTKNALYDKIETLLPITSGQYKVFYTVGYSDADYIVAGGSTTADVQINAAMLAANVASGGVVYVKVGTFTISDILQIPSNVTLIGAGIDVTTIKAVANYNPTTSVYGVSGRRCMLIDYNSTAINNIVIDGITFDGNVQNIPGLTSDNKHKAIWLMGVNNLRIRNIKLINTINYGIAVYLSDQLWVDHNIVWGGYSNTYDQNDGIHVRAVTNYHINFNNINTAKGGGTSGDDCIAILPGTGESGFPATTNTSYGEVIGNTIAGSGSRGIISDINSSFNVTDLVIENNVIANTINAGVKLYTAVSQTGNYYDIKLNDNILKNVGTVGSDGGHGIFLDKSNSANRTLFENITITDNTIDTIAYTSGYAIHIAAKSNDLNISGNTIDNISGLGGILLGSASNPVTDYVMNGNKINLSNSASNVKGISLYDVSRGEIIGNTLYGHTTGTTYGVYVEAATATAYNDISHNDFYTWDNGIVEVNSGANPNFNQYLGNTWNTVTSLITILGTNSSQFNLVVDAASNSNWGLGTSSASAFLHISPPARQAAPGISANALRIGGNTFTDNSTANSGTATIFVSASIGQATLASTGTSVTTTDAATLYITGGVVKGTNDTVTNSHALYINAGSVGAQTNSYGLTINAQTGAGANYAAQFLGGNVGIKTSAPLATLEVVDTIRASRTSTPAQYVEITGGGSSGQILTASSPSTSIKNFTFNLDVSGGSATTASFWAWQIDGVETLRFTDAGNVKLGGTASRGTTESTNGLVMFNGTAPVGTLTNGVTFYAAAGEARVMDAAGNSTLLSPHDKSDNSWIYHSVDTRTGKGLKIDVEKMFRFLNDKFGTDFIHEFEE